jgi:membrane-associated phospholipid phosphatase
MIGAIVYFIFFNKNKREYYQLILNLMMGMTIFVIVSYVYPNVQHLRPSEFPRDNIFTRLVGILYQADTPTNVLPSIHVFNSLAIHMAINSCEALKDRKWVQRGSLLLTILIVLSTMFLKQHTVVDVCLGATLALFGVLIFYPEQTQDVADEAVLWNYRTSKRERKSHSK